MKKIALDLDGVVFDSENLYRVYTEIYDVEKNKKDTIVDNTQRIFQKRYDWSEEEFKDFYNSNAEIVLKTANFMTGVDIVLNKLKDYFEFIVVTARNDFETEIAIEKLKTIGFGNIKVFNNEHHKIDKLLEEHVDYMIDDDNNIIGNIKAALEILIKDEKLRTKLANNGHIYAQQFNEKKYYDDFIKIIE